jgi:hypothetical protein
MSSEPIDRQQFLTTLGRFCAGSCACAAAVGLPAVYGLESGGQNPPQAQPSRSEQRIAFAEAWIRRFMNVLDTELDEATRARIMMANGSACYDGWIRATGQQITPITLEELRKRLEQNPTDPSIRVEGNVIHFAFLSAAETGQPARPGACLCSLVETKPEGLSSTYCLCSVGYVKRWHERLLGRPVSVELVESVLRGGEHCRFRITVG